MQEKIVDILPFIEKVKNEISYRISNLKKDNNILPSFLTIMVGDNPASLSYIKSKRRLATDIGIINNICYLDKQVTQDELILIIQNANNDSNIHGILLQLPLPNHLDEKFILQRISPTKDIDGLNQLNMMKFISSKTTGKLDNSFDEDFFIPCTPFGCINLLQFLLKDLEGKSSVVFGRSNLVGYPLSNLLLNNNCTVTIIHSKSKNIEYICKNADILCVAIGKAKFVTKEYVKSGSTVLDIGINRIILPNQKYALSGDIDLDQVLDKVQYITPVPKGIGPITVMFLMVNIVKAAYLSLKK